MIRDKRKNFNIGGSKGITYPYVLVVGKESTLAGDGLLLIDPQGKIPPDVLLQFYIIHIEPFTPKLFHSVELKQIPKKK